MAAEQNEEASGTPGGRQTDAMIDTGTVPRSAQKVELDLDDAPFLEEEEEVAPEPQKVAEPKAAESEEKKEAPRPDRKKLILIGAAALVVLLAAGLAAKFLLFKGPAATAKPEQPAAAQTAPAENATEAKGPEAPAVLVRLEPFLVEQKGTGDEVRFLSVRILLGSSSKGAAKELDSKVLQARNAIFYYLKNKDVQFLADEQNAEKLKNELLLVINQYITEGKFETLMFEEYVVK